MRWKVTFVAGALLGAALAFAVAGCGNNCTPASCPVGCCDAHGTCQVGNTNTACGAHGQVCAMCTLQQDCLLGTCDDIGGGCSAATCPNGCCNGSQCVQSCPTGFVCSNHACVNPNADGGCGPADCVGCCMGSLCLQIPLQSVNNCGINGNACSACPTGDVCQNGFCSGGGACNAASCPNGCCAGTLCVGMGQQSMAECGFGGAVCSACPTGETCLMGSCLGGPSCGPMTCSGCCDINGTCQAGSTSLACGSNGIACVPCPSGEICDPLGQCQVSSGDGGTALGDSCANPFLLTLVNGSASATGTTTGFNDDSAGQCGGALSPDVVYQFSVPTTFNFSAALHNGSPSWTPVMYLREWSQCATSAQIDCGAAFSPGLNVVMGVNGLDAGTYALWIDGLSVPDAGSSGAYSIVVTAM